MKATSEDRVIRMLEEVREAVIANARHASATWKPVVADTSDLDAAIKERHDASVERLIEQIRQHRRRFTDRLNADQGTK
jgi:hypothetical protein